MATGEDRIKNIYNGAYDDKLLSVFADESEEFLWPQYPSVNDEVKIRFRVAAGFVSEVNLCIEEQNILMECEYLSDDIEYFSARYRLVNKKSSYYFKFYSYEEQFLYGKNGLTKYNEKLVPFDVICNFDVPEWALGCEMYQIFTDRFCNGDTTNDVVDNEYYYISEHVKNIKDWNQTPNSFDVFNFYGGDLKGVIDKLDYLESLGVSTLYFNPLFVSPSNHKYDTQDYEHIDPHLTIIKNDGGFPLSQDDINNEHASKYKKRTASIDNLLASDEFFIEFVKQVHKRGMRVILDGVFNHCGSFHKWIDCEGIYKDSASYKDGAFWRCNSPYRDYFYFNDDNSYRGWWNMLTLPKLRYEAGGGLYSHILDIAVKWVSPPYNADGWRLDVAADLGNDKDVNRQFWRDFRSVVKKANPEAVIIAEHYGNPSDWLQGDMWDSIMNYDAFMEPASWFFTGMEKHSDYSRMELKNDVNYFWDTIEKATSRMNFKSELACMNELSNHDHSRFLTRTNGIAGRIDSLGYEAADNGVNLAIMREAVVFLFTWPGCPTIYYGDEAGLCGFTDPDNRRTYPWGHENKELIQFYRDVAGIYHEYSMLSKASIVRLACDSSRLLAYSRFNDKKHIIVIFNNTEDEITTNINLWSSGIMGNIKLRRLLCTYETGYHLEEAIYRVVNGNFMLIISSHSAVIFTEVESIDKENEGDT